MSESKCSRANCTLPAKYLIDWANPMIHCGDRKKTWAACDEHRDYLVDFVKARNFFIEIREVVELGS
jgi:hypothetical protein